MPKPAKRKTLINKLDRVFSEFIRLHYYDVKEEYIKCVTCGAKKKYIDDIHNGHFQSRRHQNTRWEEDNCAPQCVSCNTYGQGQQYKFAKYIGLERADELEEQAKIKKLPSDEWLIEKYDYYKKKVSQLVNVKFKGKPPRRPKTPKRRS